MKNVYVYKIGRIFYLGKEDKNSGFFEYEMIKRELSSEFLVCDYPEDADFIVLVSGLMTIEDKFFIEKFKHIPKILIVSDIDCLSLVNEINLKLILTQNPLDAGKYKYSYIPELFYKHITGVYVQNKIEKLFFGGSLDGREYIVKLINSCNGFSLVKTADRSIDQRLQYRDYLKLASLFKYHLIAITKEAAKGWVTSRFVECIKLGSIPIVVGGYDFYGHFNIPYKFRAESPEEIKKVMSLQDQDIYFDLQRMREKINEDSHKFLEIMRSV